MLNFYTLKASNKIAKERGKSFVEFERSKYATGEYFDSFALLRGTNSIWKGEEKIFAKLPISTAEDWKQLKEDVMSSGLYHQNRLIAPTGFNQLRKRNKCFVHPMLSVYSEERQEKKTGKTYYQLQLP